MTRIHSLITAAVAVLLLVHLDTFAKPVTLEFTGTVLTAESPFTVADPWGITAGDPVSASLRYDTDTPDWPLYTNDLSRGSFVGPGWLKVQIKGMQFESTNSVQVDILHDSNGGQELFMAMNPNIEPIQIFMAFWETGPPYDLLKNAELPLSIDLSRADTTHSFISGLIGGNPFQIIIKLAQASIPAEVNENDWERRYYFASGIYGLYPADELKRDASGNLYIAGTILNTNDNFFDTVILKYDTFGALQWSNVFGTEFENETAQDFAVAPDGTTRLLTLGNITAMTRQALISSFDTNGNRLWEIPVADPLSAPSHIRVDAFGNSHVPYFGTNGLTVAKYDPNGIILRSVMVDNSEDMGGYHDLRLDAFGNTYVISEQSFLTKLDFVGTIQWQRRFVLPPLNESKGASDLTPDEFGNVIVTGSTSEVDKFGRFHRYLLTTKYNRNGKISWSARFESPTGQEVRGLKTVADSKGNVYVAGYDVPNIITLKYNRNGKQLWWNRYPHASWPQSLAVDETTGAVYVSGGQGLSATLLAVPILKIDQNGNRVGEFVYHGSTNSFDQTAGLLLGQSNRVYFGVTSYTDSDLINFATNAFICVGSHEFPDLPGAPRILKQPRGRTVREGSRTEFQVTASGTRTLFYQWLKNGIELTDGTNSTLVLENVSTNSTGNYSIKIHNHIGSVTSPEVPLKVRSLR